ncbi:hypothetical protein M0657_002211 [Pyricularia oryzae]|nr:hypothetical protein M9X92_005647 [Pyricularia oryzae]KAI7929533.1 hypothetical protein M0657_002211 [Pyricularia oryzae]
MYVASRTGERGIKMDKADEPLVMARRALPLPSTLSSIPEIWPGFCWSQDDGLCERSLTSTCRSCRIYFTLPAQAVEPSSLFYSEKIRLGQARADRPLPLILDSRQTIRAKGKEKDALLDYQRTYPGVLQSHDGLARSSAHKIWSVRIPQPLCLSCQLAIVAPFSPELKGARGRPIGFVCSKCCLLVLQRRGGKVPFAVIGRRSTKAGKGKYVGGALEGPKGREGKRDERVETGKMARYKYVESAKASYWTVDQTESILCSRGQEKPR